MYYFKRKGISYCPYSNAAKQLCLLFLVTGRRSYVYHDQFYLFVQLMLNKNDHFSNRFTFDRCLMPLVGITNVSANVDTDRQCGKYIGWFASADQIGLTVNHSFIQLFANESPVSCKLHVKVYSAVSQSYFLYFMKLLSVIKY